MADDAIRVLDGCGLSSAHVVGMSLGGMIAQLAALKYPARVASVTVISSSPFVEGNTDLPGVSPAYLDHFAQFHEVNWTDRAEAIRFLVEDSRSISGLAGDS
jgi:pimeloyl-ACP methyl ester carboxylesterase